MIDTTMGYPPSSCLPPVVTLGTSGIQIHVHAHNKFAYYFVTDAYNIPVYKTMALLSSPFQCQLRYLKCLVLLHAPALCVSEYLLPIIILFSPRNKAENDLFQEPKSGPTGGPTSEVPSSVKPESAAVVGAFLE